MRVVSHSYPAALRFTTQSGFSMFEVLITMVVIGIGLVGLAGVQAIWVKHNNRAYHISQATVLAYDMADRMRANVSEVEVDCGDGPRPILIPQDNYTTMTVAQAKAAGAQSGCGSLDGCSAAQLAQNDLRDWGIKIAADLPGGTGSIAQAVVNCVYTYTITVNWDEDADGDADADDPNLQVSFQKSFQP